MSVERQKLLDAVDRMKKIEEAARKAAEEVAKKEAEARAGQTAS